MRYRNTSPMGTTQTKKKKKSTTPQVYIKPRESFIKSNPYIWFHHLCLHLTSPSKFDKHGESTRRHEISGSVRHLQRRPQNHGTLAKNLQPNHPRFHPPTLFHFPSSNRNLQNLVLENQIPQVRRTPKHIHCLGILHSVQAFILHFPLYFFPSLYFRRGLHHSLHLLQSRNLVQQSHGCCATSMETPNDHVHRHLFIKFCLLSCGFRDLGSLLGCWHHSFDCVFLHPVNHLHNWVCVSHHRVAAS